MTKAVVQRIKNGRSGYWFKPKIGKRRFIMPCIPKRDRLGNAYSYLVTIEDTKSLNKKNWITNYSCGDRSLLPWLIAHGWISQM